jgi:poly(beta-D-mannuronate) lyase
MKYIFFTIFSLLASTLFANKIFVDNINDLNTQLNKAVSNDTVVLKNGSYNNAVIVFTNTGITCMPEEQGKVIFTGNSTLSFAGSYNTISGFVWKNGGKDLGSKSVIEFRNGKALASYCTLSDCLIDEYNTADFNTDNKWISLYGTYNTVARCLLANKYNRGATLTVWLEQDKPAYHTINHNFFYNRQNGPNVDNGLESIRIGDSKTSFTHAHCVVAFNRFEKCDGEIEIISNKSCYNSYLHNTFVNNDGGLTLRHGNYCRVEGNYFDGGDKNKSYGIRFIGEGHVAVNNYLSYLRGATTHAFRAPLTLVNGVVNTEINGYFQVKNAFVQGNIFVNCIMPAIRVGAFSNRDRMTQAPDSVNITDNVIVDDAGLSGDVYEELSTPTHITFANNEVMGKNLSTSNEFKKIGKKLVRDGYISAKDEATGKVLYDMNKPKTYASVGNAGANFISSTIARLLIEKRYTYLSAKEVGPLWMR